jgi:hypothetical protein
VGFAPTARIPGIPASDRRERGGARRSDAPTVTGGLRPPDACGVRTATAPSGTALFFRRLNVRANVCLRALEPVPGRTTGRTGDRHRGGRIAALPAPSTPVTSAADGFLFAVAVVIAARIIHARPVG